MPPEQVGAAGRLIQTALRDVAPDDAGSADQVLTALVLGQCTTSWLVWVLTAEAWGRGTSLRVSDGEYDNVVQELSTHPGCSDVVVLVPWHQRLLAADDRAAQQRIDDELVFWRRAWDGTTTRGARLVQVGYDAVLPGSLGYHLGGGPNGTTFLIRRMNEALRANLPVGAYFVDLEQIAGTLGRESFYDARQYFWTKQPFSARGVYRLAEHIWAGIRAVTTGPKKVLVLDLDNTLWGGVVGEVGPLGIELGDSSVGEAYRAVQQHCRDLAQRGVVLAVCSKNNPADAREPFARNRDMVLTLDDCATFEASWDPKPVALRRIARTLRLGLDSFVFFDDDPAEREHVRQTLPDVEVVEIPPDPADYIRALQDGLWFEAVTLTAADTERTAQYRADEKRRAAQDSANSVEDYLRSLGMQSIVRPIDEADLPRVVQLLGKTNQFNLTTRRHTADDVWRILSATGSFGLTLRLRDRFSDYGLISVVLAAPLTEAEQPTLRLDTWLMSCRAIGRTVEDYFLNCIAAEAQWRGYVAMLGEFIPTEKNGQVAGLYQRFGFMPQPVGPNGVRRFRLSLCGWTPRATFVVDAECPDGLRSG